MRQVTSTMRRAAVWLAAALTIVAVSALMPVNAWADEAVAAVDDAQYATLQEAVDAAEDGSVVVLTQDATLDAQLSLSGKSITLDLGGFTLTVSGTFTEAAIVVSGGGDVVIQNGTIDDVRAADGVLSGLVSVQVQNATSLTTSDLVVQACAPSEVDAENVLLVVGTEELLDSPDEVPAVTLGSGTVLQDAAFAGDVDEADEVEEDGGEADEAEDVLATGTVAGVVLIDARYEETDEDDPYEAAEDYAGTSLVVADGATIVVTGTAIESDSSAWGTTLEIEDGATVSSTYGYGIYQPGYGSVTVWGGVITGVWALYEGDADAEVDAEAASEDEDEALTTSLYIRGGIFVATGEDAAAVYSANCTAFIVAGLFSTEPNADYVYGTSTSQVSESDAAFYEVVAAVTVTGYEGTYDGESHSGSVTVSESYQATTIQYSTDGENYSDTCPSYVNAGEYVIYYQVVYGDEVEETGTLKISIEPAVLTATYTGETVSYGSDPTLSVTVAGFIEGESADSAAGYVAPTLSTSDCTAEGSYTLAPEGGAATNYVFEYVSGTLVVTHSTYYVEAVASTCAATGVAAHYACYGCSTLFSDEAATTAVEAADLALAAVEHAYDEGSVTTAATCEETGTFTYTCTVCGAVITESIPATGHDYVAEWTWSDDLSTATLTLTCANDSSHFTFIDGIVTTSAVTTAATEDADGVITYTAQATYSGVGYTDTQTVSYEYTGEATELETLADETEEDATVTESSELASEASDAEGEESGDGVIADSGDDMTSVVVIVIAVAIIAVAILLIAFVAKRRNSR